MSRYRPPTAPKSPYITRQGYQGLQSEQQQLWQKRRQVVQHLAAAAAEGDRSENAEYIYRKKQLRELDRRIRYLQKRLPQLKVVDNHPDNHQQVFFGAWVTVIDQHDREQRYRIVGSDEFDPKQHWISIDSPLAKALLKRQLDDEFEIELPGGRQRFEIIAISYEQQ